MTRSLAIALVLALSCAAGLWLFSHRSTEPLSTPLPSQAQSAPAVDTARPLESEPVSRKHEPAAPPPRVISSKPDPIVGPKAMLEVLCVGEKDGRALPGVSLRLQRELDEQEARQPEWDDTPPLARVTSRGTKARGWKTITDEYFRPTSGADGRISLEVPAGVELSGSVSVNGLHIGSQSFSCKPLDEGEQRLVSIRLPTADDQVFRAVVLDATSAEPLSDVQVSSRHSSQTEHKATTGNDGRFELTAAVRSGMELQLEKQDYVTQLVHITIPDSEPAEEPVFRLVRGATVQGFLLDADGAPVHQSSVRLWRDSGFESRAFCDARGWFAIDGLPPGIELQVEIEQWRRRVRGMDPLAPLEPGETRRLDLRMPPRVRLEGVALDEERAPITGIELALLRVPAAGLACVDASLVPEETVKTDAEGKFAFTSASEGTWAIAPAMRTTRYTAREPPVIPRILVLPEAARQPIEVQIYQHASIQGRVLEADGKPARGALVYFSLESCRNSACVQAAEDGSFRANVSGPWTYRIHASIGRGGRDSEELQARAGDAALVLKLGAAARLQVHVSDPRGGDLREGRLLGIGASTFTGGSSFTTAIGPDGRAGVELQPGSYRFIARVGAKSWSDVRTATIESGKPSETLELDLRPTGWITFDASRFQSQVELELRCEGITVGQGVLDPLVPQDYPAPPGSLVIAYRAEKGSGEWKHADCSVQPGEKSKLTLEP